VSRPLSLTVGLIDQTVDVVIGRLVTIGLAECPVVHGHFAAGRRGLHHAERGVRTHVEVDALAAAARVHFLRRGVPFPQRGRRVLYLLVHLVTGLPLGWAAAAAACAAANDTATVPRVLRAILFPAITPEYSAMITR
jgi:hypothetical protein